MRRRDFCAIFVLRTQEPTEDLVCRYLVNEQDLIGAEWTKLNTDCNFQIRLPQIVMHPVS